MSNNWNEIWGVNENIQPKIGLNKVGGSNYAFYDSSLYIKDSYFQDTHEADGGAINIQSNDKNDLKLLVESTSIVKSEAYMQGGAIWTYIANCILIKVCGIETISNSEGAFMECHGSSSDSSKNQVLECSITKCSGSNTVNIRNGNITLKSLNLSHNIAGACSAFQIKPSASSDDPKGIVSQCSVSNNTANDECIIFDNSLCELSTTNIIYNKITEEETNELILFRSKAIFKHASILGNVGGLILNNECGESIHLDNCTIGLDQDIKFGEFQRINTPDSFLNGVSFIVTGGCVQIPDEYSGIIAPTTPKPFLPTHKQIINSLIYILMFYIILFCI